MFPDLLGLAGNAAKGVPCADDGASWWWWLLWCCVVAGIAFFPAEAVKVLWLKRTAVWLRQKDDVSGNLAKISLLSWVLFPVGAAMGWVLFPEQLGLSVKAALSLGAFCGLFSGPLVHDFILQVPTTFGRALKRRLGAETRPDIETIDEPLPPTDISGHARNSDGGYE